MKKLLMTVLCGLLVLGMVGCKKGDDAPTADTLGASLQQQFEAEAKNSSDVKAIAEKLSTNSMIEFKVAVDEVKEGYLAGFNSDVTGFKSGYTVYNPMMGYPFVCYVFEVDDAAAFLETLKGIADPRWNICTEAQETVSATSGNLVFFAMCPGEEE